MLKMEDGFIFVCKMFLQTTMQSMAATADLLLWLKLAVLKDVEFVTFFNDGDDRTKKPIGKTKGIYSEDDISYDAIKKKMYFTMLKGGG
jgi:hypothetical protein